MTSPFAAKRGGFFFKCFCYLIKNMYLCPHNDKYPKDKYHSGRGGAGACRALRAECGEIEGAYDDE
jgi:hypothetical protein